MKKLAHPALQIGVAAIAGIAFCLLAALAGDVGFSVVTTALKYLGTTLLGVLILFMLFVAVLTVRTRV